MPDYLEGKNAVWEALQAGRPIQKIYIAGGEKDHRIGDIIRKAKERKILIDFVSEDRIKHLAQSTMHQGILAMAGEKEFAGVDEILAKAQQKGETPFLLILDQVEDPHNLGSLVRTCEAAGVHGIIIPQRRSVGLTSTVAKVASGALEFVPVAQVVNISQTMQDLKKKGLWMVGAEADGEKFPYEIDLRIPLALVLGSEGHGVRQLVREECDWLVKIPMYGSINSLNVSVAGAVLMYEVLRQRRFFCQ